MGSIIKRAGIYMIFNVETKKSYIGYSTNITKRWATHKHNLRRNTHTNRHLQSAWNLSGEEKFIFSIIEKMEQGLTKEEYELAETKWTLHFNSHKNKYGYNACLPGSIPLERTLEMNECNIGKTSRELHQYYCINIVTVEKQLIQSKQEVSLLTGISLNKITDLCSYWKGVGKRKSLKGWMVIREEDYIEGFDYINYKKQRVKTSTKTWRDYELTRKLKRNK